MFVLKLSDDPNSPGVFFNWYYWSINIGTLVAQSGIAYLQQNIGQGSEFSGFFWGYIAGTASLVLGLIVFLTGKYNGKYENTCMLLIYRLCIL